MRCTLCSHLVRAGLLQTIQLKLAGDPLAEAPPGGRGGRKPGGAPARHIPLMLRAKEPAVEERLLRLAATGEAGGATGAAAAPAPALAAAGAGRGG